MQMQPLAEENKEYASGAGTTKRKELHGTTFIHALSGTWANQTNDVTLNAYKIKLHYEQLEDKYTDFVLLIEAKLDDDIADAEVELYLLSNRIVKSTVSPHGKVQLSGNQVEKSKLFHDFFFNGLFGKLFTRSESNGIRKEFLLKDGKGLSWSSSYMYLLLRFLPLELLSPTNHESVSIDWMVINSCVSVVNFLRSIYSSDFRGSPFVPSTVSYESEHEGLDFVHMANKSIHTQYIRGMVVLAIHTGRIYIVLDVMYDISAETSFNKVYDKKSKFISFADFYYQKYNIVFQRPGQPFLFAKQSHYPHNLLFPNAKTEGYSTSSKVNLDRTKVHLPPELLVHIDVPNALLRSFYLLPSVMHRLESMMLACQLREEIGWGHANHHISGSLILEAITTSRCCENYSMERLELLGDSVLKYSVSSSLFLNNPVKNEGELSTRRSRAVCNSTLHNLGTLRSLQGYIRDSAFDPRRWVAPGQVSLRPSPCTCGVGTYLVPLETAYLTEETAIVVGKACDKGHRWMCSKTIADCVEVLIGAYFVGGGLPAALSLMRWLGVDATTETLLMNEAKMNASLFWHDSKVDEIDILESKLDYVFTSKGLLLEAITHPSQREIGFDYCYQRLEFLGDSVLDLLITWHLFQNYTYIDPGELTDLRSASVSNENFAQATLRHNLQHHFQHASDSLLIQITECKSFTLSDSGPKAPKAFGDIFESIAGAVLIDTFFDLHEVWRVFEPLISPIPTPDNLELAPLRELLELCANLGYPVNKNCTKKGEQVVAELSVQLEDDNLISCGCDMNSKHAKAQAAVRLLRELKNKGISHAQSMTRRQQEVESSLPTLNSKEDILLKDSESVNIAGSLLSLAPFVGSASGETHADYQVKNENDSKMNEPVALTVSMEKGGPRVALVELCRISNWPMPRFEFTELKSRTPIELNGVTGFSSFTASITLHIPHSTVIKLEGDPRTDKKSSRDSAALTLLGELQKQGRCVLREP